MATGAQHQAYIYLKEPKFDFDTPVPLSEANGWDELPHSSLNLSEKKEGRLSDNKTGQREKSCYSFGTSIIEGEMSADFVVSTFLSNTGSHIRFIEACMGAEHMSVNDNGAIIGNNLRFFDVVRWFSDMDESSDDTNKSILQTVSDG